MPREYIDLCGVWKFKPNPWGGGEDGTYARPDYDPRRWPEVQLPCDFDSFAPILDAYEGTGWFRRNVVIPDEWRGKRVVLHFEGVNYQAKVWVNGVEAGEHQDGFLPFDVPLDTLAEFGCENLIVVRVDNTRRDGDVPGLQRGWRTYGGILREVGLVATDPLHIDHTTIVAEPSPGGGALSIRAEIANDRPEAVEADLTVRIADNGESLANTASKSVTLGPGERAELLLEHVIENAKQWSPDEPNLYTASIELRTGGRVADETTTRFGFRKIEAKDGKLLLNGEPIFLTGFNRHEDSPRTNMSPDMPLARRDLVEMKEAGSNFVRLCHYPHHPAEIDICDELGLLVMDEIPLYWWLGCKENKDEAICAQTLAAAKRQLTGMIRRDINHPSIIFWSVSNENLDQQPEVADGNRELARLAKQLDPTRLAVHVSSQWVEHPTFEDDDVMCVNGYPGGKTEYWRDNLQKLHEKFPDKPIFVTEFGSPSFEGIRGGAYSEDAHAGLIESEFAGMQAPFICGAIIWCWADHPWPAATFGFAFHLGTSPYGVVTRERRKLKPFWTAKRLFRAKQGLTEPQQPAASGAPDNSLVMIRPDLLDIPQVPFPDGFGIRPMTLDDIGLWTDIQRDAEQNANLPDSLFRQQFGHDLQSVPRRCFIVTDAKGLGVGVISSWYNRDFKGQDHGQIHWVAIRTACQGNGLGKAAMTHAMNQLARWHERCFLGTHTHRLPAIKIYLDFGFLPDLDPPGAAEKWREVRDKLKHPVLEGMGM